VKVGVDVVVLDLGGRRHAKAEDGRLGGGQLVSEAGGCFGRPVLGLSVILQVVAVAIFSFLLLQVQVSVVVITVDSVGAVSSQPKLYKKNLVEI
jgi:hypothetical protein